MKNNSFKVFTIEIESIKNNIKQFVLFIKEMKKFFKDDFVNDFRRKGFENNKILGNIFSNKIEIWKEKIKNPNLNLFSLEKEFLMKIIK